MKNRVTILLFLLFFGGLAGLWWAEWARVPTAEERQARAGRVLPDLMEVPLKEIRRVEIAGPDRRIVLEHEKDRWRVVDPIQSAADRTRIEALLQALKALPRPIDAEPLSGRPKEYGLEPPQWTVRVLGEEQARPLAELEVGATVRDRRYVRAKGTRSIEVVDAKPLASVDGDVNTWRDRDLFRMPGFDAQAVTVLGPGKELSLRRDGDRWRILSPIRAPAESSKVEGLLGDLTALRAVEGPDGFVADGVKDFAPYGLDKPALTIVLAGETSSGVPEDRVLIGKPVPNEPGHFYARRSDENDVVNVDAKAIVDLGDDPHAFRSRRVADLDLARVDFLTIRAGEVEHALARTEKGWQVLRPVEGKADSTLVRELLTELNKVETSDLFAAKDVPNAGLDPPEAVLEVWQGGLAGSKGQGAGATRPKGEPALRLSLGRRNRVGRVLYATEAGDPAILALPVDAFKVPFNDRLALLDHTIMTEDANRIKQVTLTRRGQTLALAASPENPGDYAAWRLVAPVEAPVQREAVAMLVVLLSRLRAERLVEQGTPDPSVFGFDAPEVVVRWTGRPAADLPEAEHTLEIGKEVPGAAGARFARVVGQPLVFTLNAKALEILDAEFHSHRALEFPADEVARLILRWPDRTLTLSRSKKPFDQGIDWKAEDGSDISGYDPTQFDVLVGGLSILETTRFTQYQGPFPPESGLNRPVLTVEVDLKGGLGTRRLKLGALQNEGLRYATTEAGTSGVVFLLPETGREPWSPFEKSEPAGLPANPFAQEPAGTGP